MTSIDVHIDHITFERLAKVAEKEHTTLDGAIHLLLSEQTASRFLHFARSRVRACPDPSAGSG